MHQIIEITDLKEPALSIYNDPRESRLYHFFEPKPGIFIAESARVAKRALDAGYEPLSMLVEKKLVTGEVKELLESCPLIPVYVGEEEVLKSLTGFKMTRGLLCAMRRKELKSVEEVCADAKRIVILEEVVNPTNVGAIFRSAAALGFDAVLLSAGCSDPLYRRAARVSMGTVFQIPWTVLDEKSWPDDGFKKLRKMGYATAAMALKEKSVSVDDPDLMAEEKLAVLIGNESEGLSEETIRLCDYTVMIPMQRGVDSLNAAAASAVAFWQLGKRH